MSQLSLSDETRGPGTLRTESIPVQHDDFKARTKPSILKVKDVNGNDLLFFFNFRQTFCILS